MLEVAIGTYRCALLLEKRQAVKPFGRVGFGSLFLTVLLSRFWLTPPTLFDCPSAIRVI